eukprot:8225054-Alexandrium_andersonii.AAC.1
MCLAAVWTTTSLQAHACWFWGALLPLPTWHVKWCQAASRVREARTSRCCTVGLNTPEGPRPCAPPARN